MYYLLDVFSEISLEGSLEGETAAGLLAAKQRFNFNNMSAPGGGGGGLTYGVHLPPSLGLSTNYG